MRDILVALPAQQHCAQTISANVLKSVFLPMILPEGYCPHNHDVQITPATQA